MPPLDRALALAEVDDVPVRVREHLDLDVTRAVDVFFEKHGVVAERGARFTSSLLDLLDRHKALAPKLLFEITESAAITRFDEVNNFLQVLRGRGFRLCLDDFGAGTNSFHYLRRFSVDFVKLDGQFVRQAGDSAQDKSCLKAIAKLSRDLGAATIAEMIETEDQLAMLRGIGVEFGQGYLLGRPAAQPAACDFVHAKRKRRLNSR